jgi:hypothetical protein
VRVVLLGGTIFAGVALLYPEPARAETGLLDETVEDVVRSVDAVDVVDDAAEGGTRALGRAVADPAEVVRHAAEIVEPVLEEPTDALTAVVDDAGVPAADDAGVPARQVPARPLPAAPRPAARDHEGSPERSARRTRRGPAAPTARRLPDPGPPDLAGADASALEAALSAPARPETPPDDSPPAGLAGRPVTAALSPSRSSDRFERSLAAPAAWLTLCSLAFLGLVAARSPRPVRRARAVPSLPG